MRDLDEFLNEFSNVQNLRDINNWNPISAFRRARTNKRLLPSFHRLEEILIAFLSLNAERSKIQSLFDQLNMCRMMRSVTTSLIIVSVILAIFVNIVLYRVMSQTFEDYMSSLWINRLPFDIFDMYRAVFIELFLRHLFKVVAHSLLRQQ